MAQPGRLLVIADYSQIEFRVAAELAQETDMRTLFANGIDLHRRNAVIFARCSEDQVTQAMRSKAKATGFGELFGQGPGGLVQTAWNDWRVVLSLEEAEELQRAFSQQYPRLREWQRENYNRRGRREGCVRTIRGRPLYAGWESSGRIRWTQACNFPVQGSAADLMLDALIRVAKAIAGHDARLIMQVHDELVLECAEDIVPDIEALVVEHMTAAWVELFPEAPSRGIVESRTSPVWAKEE